MAHGFPGRIHNFVKTDFNGREYALFGHKTYKIPQSLPKFIPYQNQGAQSDILGRDKGRRLKKSIQCVQPSGHGDKGTEVLDQHGLSHKKIFESNAVSPKGVGMLFFWQDDSQARSQATCLIGIPVSHFHKFVPAICGECTPGSGKPIPGLPYRFIAWTTFIGPCRAENGDRGTKFPKLLETHFKFLGNFFQPFLFLFGRSSVHQNSLSPDFPFLGFMLLEGCL